MKRLSINIALLVLVLALFYNIERLDISDENFVNIQSFVYVFGTIAVLSTLLIPFFRRTQSFVNILIWLAIYLLLKITLFNSRPLAGDGFIYLTMAEMTFIVVLILVSHLVGQSITEFESAVRQLTLAEEGSKFQNLESGRKSIHTEITRSRYYERPISVLVIDPDRRTLENKLVQMIAEMQQKIGLMYSKARLARLVRQELRLMDQIYFDGQNDQLVVVCPELDRDTVSSLAERVQTILDQEGIRAHLGWASFPCDGLTFDGLLAYSKASWHEEKTESASGSSEASSGQNLRNPQGLV
jgi:hypothetical protein